MRPKEVLISRWRTERDSEKLRETMETIETLETNGDALPYRNKEVRDACF